MRLSRRAGVLRVLLFCAGVVFNLASCASGVPEKDVAPLYYNLGNAYFELGELDRAVESYLKAIELDESLARASFNLAKVYVEKNQLDKASRILEELLTEDPENENRCRGSQQRRHRPKSGDTH